MVTQILSMVLPVLVMIVLGRVFALKGILNDERHAGLKTIVGDVLLPLVLFKAFFTAQYGSKLLLVFVTVFMSCLAALAAGFALKRLVRPYDKYMPLLMTGFACAEETARKTDFPDNTFVEMDADYITGVTQRGKTVLFRYEAQTEDGETYTKNALVYVPYGYDENDTETRYNVLYLMHGHGGGYTTFFRGAGSFS